MTKLYLYLFSIHLETGTFQDYLPYSTTTTSLQMAKILSDPLDISKNVIGNHPNKKSETRKIFCSKD